MNSRLNTISFWLGCAKPEVQALVLQNIVPALENMVETH
jgi:hypothetical protein